MTIQNRCKGVATIPKVNGGIITLKKDEIINIDEKLIIALPSCVKILTQKEVEEMQKSKKPETKTEVEIENTEPEKTGKSEVETIENTEPEKTDKSEVETEKYEVETTEKTETEKPKTKRKTRKKQKTE